MTLFWRSAQGMRSAALALMTLALLAITTVHISSQKAIAIQGPGAMQAISKDRLWLGVNNDLWVLDTLGKKLHEKSTLSLGLKEAISNIAVAPNGEVLLTTRGEPTWKVVQASDMAVTRTISPQWPDEFKGNVSRAIHVAVSPAWDIAVATGGGHTILLFGPDGKFKARSRKGAFYFTNGLWHSPQGWWTTDTNNYVLRLLDSETLAEKASVSLVDSILGYNALGEMVASNGAPKSGSTTLPFATASRLGFLMEPGHVVDVFPDGSQAVYNKHPMARVQDISWFGDKLLVVDGGSYMLRQFNRERQELAHFGDAQLLSTLQTMFDDRVFWTLLSSRYMFLVSAALLLLGIGAYSRHKKLLTNTTIAERSLLITGTPTIASSLKFKQWLWVVFFPIFIQISTRLCCVFIIFYWLIPAIMSFARLHGLPPMLCIAVAVLAIFGTVVYSGIFWLIRHRRKYAQKPEYEATLNRVAVSWLHKHDDWDKEQLKGERIRETFTLSTANLFFTKTQWFVLTNQRLLVFASNARERRLVHTVLRSEVAYAGEPIHDPLNNLRPGLYSRLFIAQSNLRVRLHSGEIIEGCSPSAVTVARAAKVLSLTQHGIKSISSLVNHTKSAPDKRHWMHVLASAVLPGVGQLLQDRFVTGAVFLTAALILLLLGIGPVLWAASGPKMHVNISSYLNHFMLWFLLIAVSAWDAFQFAGIKKQFK